MYLIPNSTGFIDGVADGTVGTRDKQVMAGNPVSLRKTHQDSLSVLRAELTPSRPIIKGFLGEVLCLDDTGVVWGLKHSKRLRIANNVFRKAGLETAWGEAKRSHTARKCNNHFGTKLNKRITPRATGQGRLRMASYERWTDAYVDAIEYHLKNGRLW